MEQSSFVKKISRFLPILVSEYDGDIDEKGLRTKYGEEQWRYEYYQRYKGGFLRDSLHGRGKYWWTLGNNRTIYEGMFYANNLEGYGKFSYDGTTVFEGLFKNNSRFGPGVFTYSDRSQDVGIWNGKDLVRLSCVVLPEGIPRIARSPSGRVKLLKYKRLVSICDTSDDRAKEILIRLEANEDVMKQSDKLYNVYIKNPRSHFFNKRQYDAHYFCDKNCYIDVALTSSEENRLLNCDDEKRFDSTVETEKDIFSVHSECVCENQKDILIAEIESELDRTEGVLKRIQAERKRAVILKQMAIRRKQVQEQQNEESSGEILDPTNELHDTLYLNIAEQKQEHLDGSLEEEIENIDYNTVCQMFDAADNAEKVLLRKKNELINKLAYENKIYEDIEDATKQLGTKKVLITDVLAWNNEEMSIDMLKHVFLHRNFEKYLSFHVVDLLTGSRSEFGKSGIYEKSCVRFLKECSDGNYKMVTSLFQCYDLNPDLCDAKGNAGIIYAAARDRIKTIRTLVNIGANVDILNDECFTALGMCIARYLAVQENITDWESAFLKATAFRCEEQREVQEWRPHISLASISCIIQSISEQATEARTSLELEALSEFFGSTSQIMDISIYDQLQQKLRKLTAISHQELQEIYTQRINDEIIQSYVLGTDIVKPKSGKKEINDQPSEVSKAKTITKKLSVIKSDKNLKESLITKSETSIGSEKAKLLKLEMTNRLNSIYETISTLLNFGASPNACEVPMPPLILSIFTKNQNMIEDLLLHNADPNITTADEKLTALHVVVSLPPSEENVQILRLLLKYSSNPNVRTDACHWYDQRVELLANRELTTTDKGKTPLHILALRLDFIMDSNSYLNQMAQMLLQHNANTNLKYLGHTPLSLAMIKGNTTLVRIILERKQENPNQKLGEEMGVPLTLYILKRYKGMLPNFATCEKIIHLLMQFKANPLNTVNNRGNVIDFMTTEHEESMPKKSKRYKSQKSSKKIKDSKLKQNKLKTGVQEKIKVLLYNITRTTLEKHIQGHAVKSLYFLVERKGINDNISENMAKFVTCEEAVRIAQLLFYRGEIPVNKELNYKMMYDLLQFIINVNCENRKSRDIRRLLKAFEFKVVPRDPEELYLPEPEADKHGDKYVVCFNCLRKKDQLLICPACRMIYYCSYECNRQDYQQKNTIHKCGTYFYKDEDGEVIQPDEDGEGGKGGPGGKGGEDGEDRSDHKLRRGTKEKGKRSRSTSRDSKGDTAERRGTKGESKLNVKGLEKMGGGGFRMPSGGPLDELRRRLPTKYQCFLERVSRYWPDLDLSLLFLPYACFRDGQLYYKFLSDKPIFMETYSMN